MGSRSRRAPSSCRRDSIRTRSRPFRSARVTSCFPIRDSSSALRSWCTCRRTAPAGSKAKGPLIGPDYRSGGASDRPRDRELCKSTSSSQEHYHMKVSSLAVAAVLVALTGCGRSSAGAGQGGPLDVAGQVIFQLNGGAVPGAKVKVGNKAVVTTSPEGKFSVRSVSNPYDITVVSPDGSVAAVYAGLTRTDPTVALRLTGPGAPAPIRSATITGRLSGGVGFPLPAGHGLQAFFTAPAGAAVAIENGALDADGSYTLFLNWRGDANVDCTVRLVEFVADAGGNPVSFDATGSIPLNLASGQTSSGIDINLGPVGNVRF